MSISNRYEFMFYVQCINGNPNGDPDMDNLPRSDQQNMQGYITDSAIKHRIRNYIIAAHGNEPGMGIIMQDSSNINTAIAKVREGVGLMPKNTRKEDIIKARKAACDAYYDVRTFGGVLSTGPNAGQVRGPVEITFGKSLDPIFPQSITITRVAATNDVKDKDEKTYENYVALDDATPADKLRTMGRKQFIPFGLYAVHGFISANLAEDTGFNDSDLNVLFEAILNMYEHDRSASKGEMAVVSPLIIFKHVGSGSDAEQRKNRAKLGCVPAHKLFELVKVTKKPGVEYPRNYTDYDATVDISHCPKSVEIGFMEFPFDDISWNTVPENSWLRVLNTK